MQIDRLLLMISQIILEGVRAAGPLGAPGGHLYADLMIYGCTLEQFESIMRGMVGAGLLVKNGQCYLLGPNAPKVAM
jgi:hypothetical protein